MKKYYVLILFALISFCACTEKNNPEPQIPWNETGYRLDSVIVYHSDDAVDTKTEYFYSVSSEYCDSSYEYILRNNQWELHSKYTYKYDRIWNIIEQLQSNFVSNNWSLSIADYFEYNTDRDWTKQTSILYMDDVENHRDEHQYEYDSFNNIIFISHETFIQGELMNSFAEKYENYYSADNLLDSTHVYTQYDKQVPLESSGKTINYYTGNHLDSVYTYRRDNGQAPYEYSGKTIYTNEGEKNISISYNYIEYQFVLASKFISQYDSHNNALLSNLYSWQNDDWAPNWLMEWTYQYVPDSDLKKEVTRVGTDYFINGDVKYTNEKTMYYYTKL